MTRTIYRERIPTTDRRLGRHVHHDSESRRYEYRPSRTAPVSVRHPRRIAILDQGQLGSCTGNAGVGCLGTDPYFATQTSKPKYSEDETGAVALYSDATAADGYPGQYPPTDTGSDGLTIAKVLKSAGAISGYQHTFSLDAALLALADYPVITGVNWYEDMFSPGLEGVVRCTGKLAGGHEFVVDEYDAGRGLVGCSNSWGTNWGLRGRFFIQAEDWGTLLSQQGDVTVFTPITQPAPTPTPVPPVPGDPDHAFAAAFRTWEAHPRVFGSAKLKAAGQAWLAAKGL